ncbi:hypothetical protein SB6422_05831 [Klebsiella huaxiensis]|uniref:Uncharacterized protein n=1 Tax=Klebsiella huaxiensis TaxID=2153354 RepID=A0A564LPM0_9ENTR|nr:hypothetical protein SB6422_05831 [Klebsiella huaxiensis]
MPRQTGTVGNNRITEINAGLLTQDLAHRIRTGTPGTWYPETSVTNGAKDGVRDHVV